MGTILVTGGAGYVGAACCRQLLENGHEVEIVDNFSTGRQEAVPEGANVHRLDIGDRPALSEILESKPFDAVFHFAAKALIPESVRDPGVFFDVNVASSISLLETIRKHGIRTFVFSSTAAVYGAPERTPIVEDHPTHPVTSYGESKLAFERILQWYARAYGWSIFAFRYFNACGGAATWGELHDPETHILPLLLQAASGRRSHFEIYGGDYPTPDGTCLRDFVHVLDIADAHLLALQEARNHGFRVYNIGSGTAHSVRSVCRKVEQITGRTLEIRMGHRRAGDPAVLCASPQRLQSELGWSPRRSSLEEIIRGAWEWEKVLASRQKESGVLSRANREPQNEDNICP